MIGLFLAMTLLGADAPAPDAAGAPAAPSPAVSKDDEMVCKEEPVTGTRFTTKKCHTRREWHQMSEDARRFVDDATTNRCGGTTCK